jgi:hypothetical protein
VCCQVEVSATGWSLVQRSPTDCGMSQMCNHETSTKRGGPGPYKAVEPLKKNKTRACLLHNDHRMSGRLQTASQSVVQSKMQPALCKSLFNCKPCHAVFTINILQHSGYQAYTVATCHNIRKFCMLSTYYLNGPCMVHTTHTCYFNNQH